MSEIQKNLTEIFISRRMENWENPVGEFTWEVGEPLPTVENPSESSENHYPPLRIYLRGRRALAHHQESIWEDKQPLPTTENPSERTESPCSMTTADIHFKRRWRNGSHCKKASLCFHWRKHSWLKQQFGIFPLWGASRYVKGQEIIACSFKAR